MKRMLINATQAEELRMAMVDGQRLYDLNIEGPASERKKANIYKGKVTRVEPSLEAAFIDYGADRHGFLPLKEISPEYFVSNVDSGKKPNIRDVLKEGQDIVVQIDKEERGNKGAALTTYVSLAGRFIVLKPNKARSGGVSRRIVGDDRDLARQSLKDVEIPDGMSVILRTAGIDRSADELAWDLETLMKVWQAILDHVLRRPAPFLLYRESNAVIRALRDYLTNEIGEILIDDEATHKEALEFVEQVMPHNAKKLKLYVDPVPLFTRFQIETQIETAFAHQVNLPSGGSIVIDHTEALVSIDINSARATKGGDIEATALNTNLEAAEEIARQLRIRDLGGLIVIDFIDMGPQKNQRDVENRLRDSVHQDRARVQIGKISRFGLLEMSRQRLRPSIGESAYQTCPRCTGFGTIRSTESLALAILRIIGEEARKERTAKVIAQLPVEVATYLLNEKRDWVQSLEVSHDTQVVLVANAALETPHYQIRRVRDDQTELPENSGVSYALAEAPADAEIPPSIDERNEAEKAAIDVINPTTPAPKPPQPAKTGGFWAWLTGLFTSDGEAKKASKPARTRKTSARTSRDRSTGQRGRKRAEPRTQGTKRKRTRKKKAAKSPTAERSGETRKAAKGKKSQPKTSQPKSEEQSAAATDENRDGQARPPRPRRSRGGRRRRRSGADRTNRPDSNTSGTTSGDEQKNDSKPPSDQPAQPKTGNDASASKDASRGRDAVKPVRTATESNPKPVAAAPAVAEARAPRTESAKNADSSQTSHEAASSSGNGASGETAAKSERRERPSGDQAVDRADTQKQPTEHRPSDKAVDKPPAAPVERPPASRRPSAVQAVDRADTPKQPTADRPPEKAADKPPEPAVEKPQAKPEGRLLPWDQPAPAPDKPAKAEKSPAADQADPG